MVWGVEPGFVRRFAPRQVVDFKRGPFLLLARRPERGVGTDGCLASLTFNGFDPSRPSCSTFPPLWDSYRVELQSLRGADEGSGAPWLTVSRAKERRS